MNKLTNEIVLSVKELNTYCQTYHTAAGDDHRCTVELVKGPLVPALDCTDKILAHFSDALQEHYEPLRKSKEDLNTVYLRFTGPSYMI